MVWLIGIPFIIIGILCTLYAHRFGKWWILFSFKIKINPLITYKYQTIEELEHKFFETWPLKAFWLVWLWGIRIFGVMSVIVGAFVLIATIFHL